MTRSAATNVRRIFTALGVCAFLLTFAAPAAAQTPPSFAKSFSPDSIGQSSTSELTFTLTASSTATSLAFTDTLPGGLTFADPASLTVGAGCDAGTSASAPDGGTTLTFTSPRLGAGETCTVRVDVTGATAGTYPNTSSDLTSSAGNSGTATDDLVISDLRPGFTKAFSPTNVPVGGTTRLTFTIDYPEAEVADTIFNLSFVDDLPTGVSVATTPNLTNTCGGAVSAAPGDTTISLFSGVISTGSVCEIGVDVVVNGAGNFVNRSGNLTSDRGNSGFAVDEVTVTLDPVGVTKQFDDPVPPGATTDLVFMIMNSTRETVTNISFTDDLDATLSGLQAVAPFPVAPCGAGSSVSGSSVLTFSGGTLASGDSCTFAVSVQVPAGAATGSYLNVTSSVSADVGGAPGTFAPAADTLDVLFVPTLTKEFDVNQVEGGETITATFTITNTDPDNEITELQFDDDLDAFLAGVDATPNSQVNICNGSGIFVEDGGIPRRLRFSNGTLAAGASCTFSVDLILPATIPAGTYVNRTTPVLGIIGGVQVQGTRGEDQVTRAGAPRLSKEFLDPVGAGDTVDLVFTLDASESTADFTNIDFTDDLDATLSGLTTVSTPLVPCGAGSTISGGSTITVSNASVAAGDSCSFTVTLQVPAGAAPGSYTNTTSEVTADADGTPVTGDPASDDLDIDFVNFQKSFTDDPAVPGGMVTLTFTIQNIGTEALTDLTFTDDLDAVLTGLVATDTPQANVCGAGSALTFTTGVLELTGGNLAAGTNCTFSTVLLVPSDAMAGEFPNTTSSLSGQVGGSPFVGPTASDGLQVDAPLSISKSFTDDPVGAGGTVTLSFTIANTSSTQPATGISFTDDLDATLSGLVAETLPADGFCGPGSQISGSSVLTVTGANLAPTSSCTFEVTLRVPDGASGTFTNQTSDLMATLGASSVTVPGAEDDLRVVAVRFRKAFSGDTSAGGTVDLTFTIDNLAAGTALANLNFSDDLDAVIPGLTAVGTPMSGVCGVGSTLTGSSVLQLSGGTVPAASSCVFTVTLQVPANAPTGTFTNTTSPLMAGSFEIAPPASDDVSVVPAPAFSKEFNPGVIPQTGISTLEFTIDNSGSSLAASGLNFTDNLPAGVVIAAAPNAVTTCTGGTLTAAAGTGTITYSGGSVAAGATCTVSVDVTSDSPGNYDNVSGDLTSSLGNSGPAADTLSVVGGEFALSKRFTDPVLRGGAVDLEFTLVTGASFGVDEITFTDNLAATLPGLTAVGLPADGFCGPGSQITGTTVLTVTGASLAAGSSCTFSAILSVPADADLGTYSNTTSSASGVRDGGLPTTAAPATAPLEVVFLDLTKDFLDDEVTAGSTTTLRFTLVNPDDVNAITDLTFSDDLDAALPGAVAVGLPQADVCGTGSILSGSSEITLTNGSLAAGASCTFDVQVRTQQSTPRGSATNVTSPVSGTVAGESVSGDAGDVAEDSISVEALSIAVIPTLDLWGLLALMGIFGVLGWFRLRG